jgi:hypothetical protein
LKYESMENVKDFVDRKRYPFNINGKPSELPCEKYGDYWYSGDWYSGDYCSPLSDKGIMTIKGEICTNECRQEPKGNYYCSTASSWDYCSPAISLFNYPRWYKNDNQTIYGQKCLTPCKKSPDGYGFCYISDLLGDFCSADDFYLSQLCLTWNYCSTQLGYTYNNERCQGECQKYGKYYYCTTSSSWDYCSPKGTPSTDPDILCKSLDDDYFLDIYWKEIL